MVSALLIGNIIKLINSAYFWMQREERLFYLSIIAESAQCFKQNQAVRIVIQ